MKKVATVAFALITFQFAQISFAQTGQEQKQQCSEAILKLVGRHFGIENFAYPREGMYPSAENGGVITAGACKIWPKNQTITLAAFAYGDDSDANGKSLVFAMVDTRKNAIISAYKGEQESFAGFGVAENGLRIDTARYDIAPGIRAFGLDVTEQYNPNCGDGGYGPSRTLFIQDGKIIRPILQDFLLSTWRFVQGGNPRCGAGNEEVINEYVSYSIGIGTTATNGYSDLLVTATLSYDGGDKPKLPPFQYTLKYDGKTYHNDYGGSSFDKWRADSTPDKWRH